MLLKELKVDTIINKITHKDILFKGDYTIDLYQNCEFGCIYCDSSYNNTVYIKTNAVEILEKELQNLPKGRIIIGSVNDPYQDYEKIFNITRKALEIINEYGFTCHILTKSDLILRDVDLLKKIKNSFATISIISLNNKNSIFFEKNVLAPKKRLEVVDILNKNGIYSGIALIPFLPFIVENEIEYIFKETKKHNLKYILYKHLELKGDQKQIFFKQIKNYHISVLKKYENLYKDSYFPNKNYLKKIDSLINKFSKKYNIKIKI